MKEVSDCHCNDDWEAWVDMMPPNRNLLHVNGSCTCNTAGHHLRLVRAEPQGINPEILLLRIEDRTDTMSPQHVQTYPLEYEEEGAHYRQVTILPCEITVDVRTVS